MIINLIIIFTFTTAIVGLYFQLIAKFDPELITYLTMGFCAVSVAVYLWATKEQRVYFDED